MWLSSFPNTIYRVDCFFPIVYSWLLCLKLINCICMGSLLSLFLSLSLCFFFFFFRHTCGMQKFSYQGLNLCVPQQWQLKIHPLSHQGTPCVSLFMSVPYYFDYCRFVVYFQIRVPGATNFVLSQDCFWDLLWLHTNFRIVCSISVCF